jgi:hypothetical protein
MVIGQRESRTADGGAAFCAIMFVSYKHYHNFMLVLKVGPTVIGTHYYGKPY